MFIPCGAVCSAGNPIGRRGPDRRRSGRAAGGARCLIITTGLFNLLRCQQRSGPGARPTHCAASQTLNISRFQEFKNSTRQDLEILTRFQHFNISRIEDFKIQHFKILKLLSTFQDFNISRIQDFKVEGAERAPRSGRAGGGRVGRQPGGW